MSGDVVERFCGDARNGGLLRDMAFTVWSNCHNPKHEDGNSDWGNDNLPTVNIAVEELRGCLTSQAAEIERLKHDIARYVEANTALMAERTSLIETKREQIGGLTKERDEALETLLLADRFKVGEQRGSPVWVVSRGTNSWAVYDGSFVLNDEGEWEAEPFPSSRTDAFLSRTRFAFADAIRRARTLTNGGENGR